jgi:hypothetical protein
MVTMHAMHQPIIIHIQQDLTIITKDPLHTLVVRSNCTVLDNNMCNVSPYSNKQRLIIIATSLLLHIKHPAL